MATYTFIFTRASGYQTANLAEFPDDATAINDATGVLSEDVVVVAIGRGNNAADADWLGSWDWNVGNPRWAPGE
jgi:hypothetical protein